MKKKVIAAGLVLGISFVLMACGRLSEEKINQAQSKYNQLVEIHNEAMDAANAVQDDYLDMELTELSVTVKSLMSHNLAELTGEEIDRFIQDMDNMIGKYESNVASLADKMKEEQDAVMVEVPITVVNQTGMTLKEFYLYPESANRGVNVLDGSEAVGIGETLAGLRINKDIDATPWEILMLDEEGKTWEIVVQIKELNESGATLVLQYDSEKDKIIQS